MYKLNSFFENHASVYEEETGKYFYIDIKGEVLFELPEDISTNTLWVNNNIVICKSNEKQALINDKGEFLCDFIYDFIEPFDNEDFARVEKDDKWGYINSKGKEIIPCIYDDSMSFSEGILPVCLDNKWGAVDFNNNTVIPFIYDDLSWCYNNLISAKLNNKCGLIDKFNDVIADFKFDFIDIGSTKECICYPARIGKSWGFIDRYGNTVEEFRYNHIFDTYCGEYYKVYKDDRWALYSAIKGRFLTDFDFEVIVTEKGILFSPIYSQGRLGFIQNGKKGFIDTFGKIVAEPVYDEVRDFREGIAIVLKKETLREGATLTRIRNLYGAINIKGEVVIPLEYEELDDCSDGLILAKNENDEEGFVDKKNNIVIPFGKFHNCRNFSYGFAAVKTKDDKAVYIDKQGKILEIKV